MAEFNLGQVAFFDKGLFSLSETYTKWDFVTTTDSTYLCVSETPIIGKEVTNTTYWKCIADGKPATLAATLAAEKALYAKEQGELAQTARENIEGDLAQLTEDLSEYAIKDEIENAEQTTSEILNALHLRLKALEKLIREMKITTAQVGVLDITGELRIEGSKQNNEGPTAPNFVPDRKFQKYIKNTEPKAIYESAGNSSVADWILIS